ncbi:MAG: prolipoprotein diacylglyceryl transferase [Anaerolinea sp.]|nr:prolipoprotein diacylglyceryl transferase [Anaerolinea sp.]
MSIDRMGIHLGSFLYIRFYALIIISGALLGAFVVSKLAKKKKMDPEIIWDVLPWILIVGIIGARLWHIFTPAPSLVASGITTKYYLTHPLEAIAIWNGGLGIVGGVIGGALALVVYLRKKKMQIAPWLDVIAPGVILAQAIGRWGNFVNQELYGGPTNLPWKIFIEPAYRYPGFESFSYYHPTFLYESLWNLLVFAILLWVGSRFIKWLKNGDVFLLYLIGYSIGRYLMEYLRLDSSTLSGINANQMFMAIVCVISIGIMVFRHLKKKEPVAIAAEEISQDKE